MIQFTILIVLFGVLAPFFGKKYFKIYYFLFAIALGVLAFHISFGESSDLYRHFSSINDMRGNNVQSILMYSITHENPLTQIVYGIFSLSEDSRFFPGVMTFLTYFFMFNLVEKVSIDNEFDGKASYVFIYFIVLNYNFFLLANCIRVWFVFGVFFNCLYQESVRKKNIRTCWIVYFSLVLYHYSTLFLLMSRLISMIIIKIQTKSSISKRALAGVLIMAAIFGYMILSNDVLRFVVTEKFVSYNSYSVRGTWQTIIGWIRIILVVLPAILIKNHYAVKIRDYSITLILLFWINIVFCTNYVMILRFGDGFIASAPVILGLILNSKEHQFSMRYLSYYEFVLLVSTIFVFFTTSYFCYSKELFFAW